MMSNLTICTAQQYDSGYELKNVMGGECYMYGVEVRFIQSLVVNLKERDYTDEIGVDGRIMLTWILKFEWQYLDRIPVAQCELVLRR
jgi:hypothetical protein